MSERQVITLVQKQPTRLEKALQISTILACIISVSGGFIFYQKMLDANRKSDATERKVEIIDTKVNMALLTVTAYESKTTGEMKATQGMVLSGANGEQLSQQIGACVINVRAEAKAEIIRQQQKLKEEF